MTTDGQIAPMMYGYVANFCLARKSYPSLVHFTVHIWSYKMIQNLVFTLTFELHIDYFSALVVTFTFNKPNIAMRGTLNFRLQ